MGIQQQNVRKPWLVSDPGLSPALNRARREVFSLTTVSCMLWVVALCYRATVPWVFLLETACMFLAFNLMNRHGQHVRMILSRPWEIKVRQPTVFYVLGVNPAIMALIAQVHRGHKIPVNSESQLLPWMACLAGIILSFLFIYAGRVTRGRSAADYIVIIPFLFLGGWGMMRMLNDTVEMKPAVVFPTAIVDKRRTEIHKKNSTYWKFEFIVRPGPAGPAKGGPVSVSNGLFEAKDIGDSISVEVHQGALFEPWFRALPE